MTTVAPASRTVVSIDQGPSTRLEAHTTLADMRARVHTDVGNPLVWETARKIIANVQPRDEVGQAQTIRAWALDHWRFVNDPLWHQLLTTPAYCLEQIQKQGYCQGNCADAAMLTAALCAAVHIQCRFAAVAFHSPTAPYSHVFTLAYPRTSIGSTDVVEQDITRPPGLKKAGFTRRLLLTV